MIHIRQLHKSYHTEALSLHVLKGLNLDIETGEYVSITGASGSGKSTLLNILGILDSYDQGDYHLNGSLIKNLSEREAAVYRNEMIGFVFQSFNLINFKNALENVALPLYYKKVSRKKRNIIAMEHLDKMGLKDWAKHLPNELSGGQKQRVAIARAMISNPKVILADEPTGALDSTTTLEVMDVLTNLNREGITTIIVTHEKSVSDATNRIIHLKDGMIEYETRKNNGVHDTIQSVNF
ncbi:MAG: ABC transporter ATP-binding protein [Proteiniphilum sp.]|jgi:putative ABC transport system ATP-binding protein|nr:ABC transporter ATP-binding protein [Proteiniphilum sp.]